MVFVQRLPILVGDEFSIWPFGVNLGPISGVIAIQRGLGWANGSLPTKEVFVC